MNNKEIIEILDVFSEKSLMKLTIKKGDFTLEVEKSKHRESPAVKVESQDVIQQQPEMKTSLGHQVKSPLVGVFYQAPSPQSDPFVKLGDHVEEGQVICIIEAMKMINEIKAPVAGVISKINFKNEELVQYDDVIMEIEENV